MPKAQESRDLATKTENMGLPAELSDLFNLQENMADVEARLPQINIIHQGQMFEMPDGNKVQDFQGIILDINRVNAWWEVGFDESGGGSPPQCFSMDGVKPSPLSENRQSTTCAECEQNKYGSDGGRGKACKNMKRVHVMLDGEFFPVRLTLPPSNLKAIDAYITNLTSKGFPYQLVKTNFTLTETSNKDGIKYSQITCKPVEYITDAEQAQAIKKLFMDLRPIMREQAIGVEEYAE